MTPKSLFTDVLRLNDPANLTLRLLAEAAYLWSYRGEFDKANQIFQALAMLAPNDPVPRLGLSEVYLSQNKFRESEREAELATKVENLDRRTMAFAFKLRGKALLQLKKPKDAEKMWKRAKELDPDGPEGQAAQVWIDIAKELGLLTA